MTGAQRGLVDVELVRIHRALHDGLAKAVGRCDEHDVAEAGVRVQREHHAARADVGADHVLNARRQGDLFVREALVHAIRDRAIVEKGSEHFVDAPEQRIAAAHIEKRFLLTGERSVRQVLRRRGGAHGDGDVASPAHALEGFENLAFKCGGEGRGQNPGADLRADRRELLHIVDVQRLQRSCDAIRESFMLQEVAIGLRSRRESRRHDDAERRKVADHLAERGILASYRLNVMAANLLERNRVCSQGRSS